MSIEIQTVCQLRYSMSTEIQIQTVYISLDTVCMSVGIQYVY